jgi:outer membrane cobalamin receptor
MNYLLLVAASTVVLAQSTATLRGVVVDPSGAPLADVHLSLDNAQGGFHQTATSDASGTFPFTNLPLAAYRLIAERDGFAASVLGVSLRSNVPVEITVRLDVASERTSIEVDSGAATLLDPQSSSTTAQINNLDIDRIPATPGARGIEAALARFPGFAKNANGAIHPRGAHNQMTFVIDGMPVSDQLNGAFANTLDPAVAQTVELFTGNISAEYFGKTGAVANITTKSGFGTARRISGSTSVEAASFDLLSQTTHVAGERGRLAYSSSVTTLKTHRFLDALTLDNLHNGGNSERGFSRVDLQASPRDSVRMTAMIGRSSFELANLPSQQANGQRQRQYLGDVSIGLGWVRSLAPNATMDATASYRTALSRLVPSLGDTPYTAAQDRHLTTITTGLHASRLTARQNLRGGGDWQSFPVSEHFAVAGRGLDFEFRDKATGQLHGLFVQDAIRLKRVTLSLGLRYDQYRFLVQRDGWQPRIGVALDLRETGTVLRASYNRLLQTPPNENLLLSASRAAARLAPPSVQATFGDTPAQIRPERQNVFEVGLQQALGSRLALNGAFYHRNAQDQQDNNNFLNTGVIFPITLKSIRVNGAEARLMLLPTHGFSGNLAFTHARAVSTPPFTGGLYLDNTAVDALSQGPFVIDHDQTLSLVASGQFAHRTGWWVAPALRYDSGLVANPSDPAEVAADPDFAALLPYVNLDSATPRVRPRTIVDLAFGQRFSDRSRWEWSASVGNVFNRKALYNFQSIFVGTRVVAPRTFGIRLRCYF